jgi:hypothetical protein
LGLATLWPVSAAGRRTVSTALYSCCQAVCCITTLSNNWQHCLVVQCCQAVCWQSQRCSSSLLTSMSGSQLLGPKSSVRSHTEHYAIASTVTIPQSLYLKSKDNRNKRAPRFSWCYLALLRCTPPIKILSLVSAF